MLVLNHKSKAACRVEAISEVCVKHTGSANTFLAKGKKYFFQIGKKHSDGSITGSIWNLTSEVSCKKTGNFRIDADGKLVRGPDFFRHVQFYCLIINGVPQPWLRVHGDPTHSRLEEYKKKYLESFDEGGANSHMGCRPIIYEFRIVNENNEAIAEV